MQFFQRDVSIGKVDFNIPTKTLTINDIYWAVPEGEKLLSAKEIQIKPDFKKLLKLQIAFEEVTIDGVKTYVVPRTLSVTKIEVTKQAFACFFIING